MNQIKKPIPALLAEFDSTSFSGVLWKRGSAQSDNTTAVVMTDSVSHFDVIGYLNGYGTKSGKDLNSVLSANKPSGFTSLTAGIDGNDRFFLEGDVTFAHASSGMNPAASREMFGFSGYETVSGSGPYRLTASHPWRRGVFQLAVETVGGLKIQDGVASSVSTAFQYSQVHATNGDSTSLTFVPQQFSNGVSFSDFQVNTIISTTGGIVYQYKIAGFTNSGGVNAFVLKTTSGGSLDMAQWNQDGHVASLTSFQATLQSFPTVTDVVPVPRRVQNLPSWIRVRGSVSDADDIYHNKCLDDFEANAGKPEVNWILEDDGRVGFNIPTVSQSDHGLFAIQSRGSELFHRLGFDGTETEVGISQDVVQRKAKNRAPCVLVAGYGYTELRREVMGRDDFTIMADGSTVSSGLPPIKGWTLTMRVKGPAHGFLRDMERHLRSWWAYARRGLTLYPSFGDGDRVGTGGNDTRRHVDPLSIIYGQQDGTNHNLTQTIQGEASPDHFGKRVGGRLLLKRHPSDGQNRLENYGGDLDTHQDITFKLLDDPSR